MLTEDAERAVEALSDLTVDVQAETAGAMTYLRIPNPEDLDMEAHPFAARLVPTLERAGVRVLAAAF